MTPVLVAACLAAAAVLVAVPHRGQARRRVARLRPAPAGAEGARRPAARPGRTPPSRLAAAAAGVAVLALVGGWPGLGAGAVVAVGLDAALRRLEPRALRREREHALADLPFAADLLAAVLVAGAPVASAVGAVAAALEGPLGSRLGQVARALELGLPPDEAWAPLGDLPEAASLARSAVRTSESGAALAAALSRIAGELRSGRDARAEEAARRASVLVVLPLGLCFLPAFVLLGVVPVVAGVLGDVLG